MNDLRRPSSRSALQVRARVAALTPAMQAYADAIMRGGSVLPLTDQQRAAMAQVEQSVSQTLHPVTEHEVWAWLRRLPELADLGRRPTDDDGWRAAFSGVWLVCRDLPAGAWCIEAHAALLRQATYWPLPKEVYEAVEPFAAALRRTHFQVRSIAVDDRAKQAAAKLEAARIKARASLGMAAKVAERDRATVASLRPDRVPVLRPMWPGRDYRPPVRQAFVIEPPLVELLQQAD